MDDMEVRDRVRRLAESACAAMPVRQVILFGSYAKGTATEESDIDVAVVTDAPVDDWLESSATLYRIGGDIDLAIEPHLLNPQSDRIGFLAHVRRTGEVIYDRDAEEAA